jgi:hypothetical protein
MDHPDQLLKQNFYDNFGQSSTRTMLTEVDVNNPDLKLTPGMYPDVTFNLEQKNDAPIVP